MRRVGYQVVMAALAAGLLYLATPFIPSSVLVQVKDMGLTENARTLVRTVTFDKTVAEYAWDITRGRGHICFDSGSAVYEQRGEQELVFDLPETCDLSAPGDYLLTHCITSIGPFGTRLRATCKTATYSNYSAQLERQQRSLEEKVEALEIQIQGVDQ